MINKSVCKRVSSMLSLYIDNRVTYQQRAFIEDHLSICKECHTKYLYLKSLIKDLKASYKQVLELAVKKQQQKLFNIREHEKFLENISPYVDNELDSKACFDFRKYLMKSKSAQNELKNLYFIQKKMHQAYEQTKNNLNSNITKNVISIIKEENKTLNKKSIADIMLSPKAVKIAILSGLVFIGGYEFEQLMHQSKTYQQPSITKQEIFNKNIFDLKKYLKVRR